IEHSITTARLDRRLAGVAHASFALAPVLGPLAVYLTRGRRDEAVRRHSAAAFDFQVTYTALHLISVVALYAWMLTAAGGPSPDRLLAALGALVTTYAVAMTLSAVAAVRALRGLPARYLVAVPLLSRRG
ncbi:MAG: DUF4870 domain-containing protein, partial [Acidimicrobiia bacterium]|nr:DUF4870 domain-containing protein [Acidimicrobiia bacterium]